MTTGLQELATFKRNSMLTVDATINGLDGEPVDITALTGEDIRWAISRSWRGNPRLATLDLDDGITKVDAASGAIRIQFRAPVPPADPDPFRPGMYWQECEVVLTEVTTTQFHGPVRIEPSMFAEGE